MSASAYSLSLPISEQEIDAMYHEHSRLGCFSTDGGSECGGCLALEDLSNANERARKALDPFAGPDTERKSPSGYWYTERQVRESEIEAHRLNDAGVFAK
jgi:hypothetical protein